jgi:predicted MPP superfamily phosphohydrolase
MRLAVVGIALCALALGLAGWSIAIEPGRLSIERTTVPLPEWPAALDGFSLAAIADVHAGAPHVDRDQLARLVRMTNDARPDLVVLLGDYVIHGVAGGRFVPPEETARALAGLRGRYGVVSVLGNHDWWYDGERVRRAFTAAGIPVLENEAMPVEAGGHTVWLVGLADLWTRRVDIDGPLGKVPAAAPVIVLTHNPDVFPMVPSRVGLTLAGHTHGGQVRLPFVGRPVVPSRFGQRYAAGLVTEQGHDIFITPGVGTSIVPVRFRVPPAVSLLMLRAAPPAARASRGR